MIPIYRRITNYMGDSVIEQTVINEGQPVPEGWTADLSEVSVNEKIEQDQINRNLTLQLAKANLEIVKLKSQIGGAK